MSEKSMTVYHPAFHGVTREVATEAEREAHKAAGWRMTPIPADKVEQTEPVVEDATEAPADSAD